MTGHERMLASKGESGRRRLGVETAASSRPKMLKDIQSNHMSIFTQWSQPVSSLHPYRSFITSNTPNLTKVAAIDTIPRNSSLDPSLPSPSLVLGYVISGFQRVVM
jgi:hypothetical protein